MYFFWGSDTWSNKHSRGFVSRGCYLSNDINHGLCKLQLLDMLPQPEVCVVGMIIEYCKAISGGQNKQIYRALFTMFIPCEPKVHVVYYEFYKGVLVALYTVWYKSAFKDINVIFP